MSTCNVSVTGIFILTKAAEHCTYIIMENHVENKFKELASLIASVENGDKSSFESFIGKLFHLGVIDSQDIYDLTQNYEETIDELMNYELTN